MTNYHEDITLLHYLTKQVETINQKLALFDTFKDEVVGSLSKILATQNDLKLKQFLIRNGQKDLNDD